MRSAILLPAAFAPAVFASVAHAQDHATATITLTGHVSPRCAAGGAAGDGPTLATAIDLGKMSGANGELDPALTLANLRHDFSVLCNTAAPKVTLSALRRTNADSPAGGSAGVLSVTITPLA